MKFIVNYYRSFLIAIIILILTLLPGDSLKPVLVLPVSYIDKIAHFFVFMVLTIFLFSDIKRNINNISNVNAFLLVFLINIFYGIFIELLQTLITINRSAELFDVIADALGIVAGVFLQIKFKILKY